jgi:hypothetical protein
LRWLRKRGWSLAPLTGQDYVVLTAIAHCWAVWMRGDTSGARAAISAAAELLNACQEGCWPMARELIAHAGDWSHRDVLWPKVVKRWIERGYPAERCVRLARCHEGLPQVEARHG